MHEENQEQIKLELSKTFENIEETKWESNDLETSISNRIFRENQDSNIRIYQRKKDYWKEKDIKVVKYRNNGNTITGEDGTRFYWSFYQLNNQHVICLQYIDYKDENLNPELNFYNEKVFYRLGEHSLGGKNFTDKVIKEVTNIVDRFVTISKNMKVVKIINNIEIPSIPTL